MPKGFGISSYGNELSSFEYLLRDYFTPKFEVLDNTEVNIKAWIFPWLLFFFRNTAVGKLQKKYSMFCLYSAFINFPKENRT